ncbi:MAG: acyl-CoA carboxylase subunit beta [SAR324 cluster bacterium]|nr:acyl-CoA carboxylase subunit beta [SAR324 cluster bacterium]
MPVIQTRIDKASEDFQKNRNEMLAIIAEFRSAEKKVVDKEEAAREKFNKRGQLLPRERLSMLLDPGSPFLELSSLAGHRMYDDEDGTGAGGGIISGIGFVAGVRCVVSCSNSAIKGGTISPAGLKKSLRTQQVIMENNLPAITLAESGGANLMYQSEIFIEGGQTFANQARISAAGIPQITVVHGSSTAGGAYLPGLSDYVVMIRKKAKVFLAGPPLLKAATGEIATDEDLGGAEMHGTIAGTAEYLAEDDRDGIRIAREIVSSLGWNNNCSFQNPTRFKPPQYDAEELIGIVPPDFKKNYDVREVIARITDDSAFLEFKEEYDPYTICGHASLEGLPCGIIGNNGPITPKGAVKAAQFIQLCCQSNIPIIYLQNTTGYMVGTDAEQNGIVKHGSKMLQAVANATVPQITIVLGGSFGAGNYGMCGRGLSPRFILSWPNARIGVMGGEQAAKVMSIVTEEKNKKRGQTTSPDMLKMMEQQIIERMDKESTAIFGSARLWDDGIIDPRDTRKVLSFLLRTCLEGDSRRLYPVTFGVARM